MKSEPVKVDIPHEPGQWMEFNKLGWKKLKRARKKAMEEQRNEAKAFGAEFIAALTSGGTEGRARKLLQEQQYAVSAFDMDVLLNEGIAAWSYEDPLTPENVDELDERTAVWAAQEIIDLTRPPSEEETKNS